MDDASTKPAVGRWAAPLIVLNVALVLGALVSGDRTGVAFHAVIDGRVSNIGDPWPTVEAATAWVADHRAPLYAGFDRAGSSFIYPPVALLSMLPFAGLDHDRAWVALASQSRVLLLIWLAVTAGLARDRDRSWVGPAIAVAGALTFYPLLHAVELNQATLLVGVAVGTALVLARAGVEGGAGVALALAAALKPHLGLAVLLLGLVRRRSAAWGLVTLVGVGLVSLAVGGVANHVDYVTRVLPAMSEGYAFLPNQSFHGLVLRLAGLPYATFTLATAPPAARVIGTALALANLALVAAVLVRARSRRLDLADAVGLATVATTLASPVAWNHHHAPALFVFALLLRAWLASELPTASAVLAGLAWPLLAVHVEPFGTGGVPELLVTSDMLFGALLLQAALAVKVLSAPPRHGLDTP